MDELEHRLAAVETLLMEALAVMTDEQREQIAERLATQGPADKDEKIIRAQARGILEDARRRDVIAYAGGWRRPHDND